MLGIMGFGLAQQAEASDTQVLLRKSALISGYTVWNDTGTVSLGIQPKGISGVKKALVRIQKPQRKSVPQATENLVSDIYTYKLGKGRSKDMKLTRPVLLMMSYAADAADKDKVLKYWDTKKDKWKRMRSTDHPADLQVTGRLRHKYAMIGVFTKPAQTTGDVFEGLASWYDGEGAASNDFPYGTRIRVTNTAHGQFVDSTVVSTGPFVPGRIVDLTRDDFAAIADLSTGVIEVTVQQVEE